ncbi:methyltransferase domain-containing protein [Salinarimonas sp.]|uniref:methyltransferase domain-containing protein n=1 Tax=Salinarimonas sp. TaxID=2766526 RepID=UPI00391DC49A
MKCRHCRSPLSLVFADLGSAPPSNAYLTPDRLAGPETWLPLKVFACERCRLVQTADFAAREALFDADYAYFSSVSRSWVAHAEAYVAAMVDRFGLGAGSHVVEIAANDGYLLQFVAARGIRCLGVEPTASTAAKARERGITIVEDFFGRGLAERIVAEHGPADLTAANNVLAHVPDIDDFVAGFRILLAEGGVATFEFPSLLSLVRERQFDTIYHEHFSYLSLMAVERIFAANGLAAFDVETLPTHGGSLRVFAERADARRRAEAEGLRAQRAHEAQAGLDGRAFYEGFQAQAEAVKDDVLRFLLDAKRDGARVVGYGAAAKGNTLLNFAGVRPDLLPFVVDRSPAKQGKYLPGSRIPIVPEERLAAERPDYVLILPWNLRDEIAAQLAYVRDWGGRFVTAVPELEVF